MGHYGCGFTLQGGQFGDSYGPGRDRKEDAISRPTPKAKRTIFAVLGFVEFSKVGLLILEVNFLLIFLLDITQNKLKKTIIAIII